MDQGKNQTKQKIFFFVYIVLIVKLIANLIATGAFINQEEGVRMIPLHLEQYVYPYWMKMIR